MRQPPCLFAGTTRGDPHVLAEASEHWKELAPRPGGQEMPDSAAPVREVSVGVRPHDFGRVVVCIEAQVHETNACAQFLVPVDPPPQLPQKLACQRAAPALAAPPTT